MKLTVVEELYLKSQKVELAKRNFAEVHREFSNKHFTGWVFDVTSGEFASKPRDPSGRCLNNGGQKISTKTVEKKRPSRTRTAERFGQVSKNH